MTEHLADRDQAGAVPQQLARESVPEPVRSHCRQTGSLAGPLDDVTDQVRTDRPPRGPAGQEQMAGSGRIAAPVHR